MNPEAVGTDFDFLHNMRSTVLLLGGKLEIADLLKKAQDGAITQEDVEKLKNYNCVLYGDAKGRLAYLPTLKIRVKGNDE